MKQTWKRLLSLLLVMAILLTVSPLSTLSVAAMTEDDYVYSVVDGKAIITGYNGVNNDITLPSVLGGYPVTGIGDYAFSSNSKITAVVIPEGVTYIGEWAFFSCDNLTMVVIPSSITSIEEYGFASCYKLSSVHITDMAAWCNIDFLYSNSNPLEYGGNLYLNGEKVTDLVIPDGVVTISERTFYGCAELTTITIPASVTAIENYAFINQNNLISFDVADDNTVYCDVDGVLFDKAKRTLIQYPAKKTQESYTIPDSVAVINNHAFYNCTALTTIAIPDGVTTIGGYAFRYCNNLTTAILPDSVTKIGTGVFYDTSYFMRSLNWDNGVLYNGKHLIDVKSSTSGSYRIREGTLTIADDAFDGCSSINSVTLPASILSVEGAGLGGCSALAAIYVEEGNAFYCDVGGVLYNKEKTTLIMCPVGKLANTVLIPDTVTTIESGAFSWNDNLTEMTIPDSVTTIGEWAFYYCRNLATVTFGNGVSHIGLRAFAGCDITSVIIPNSVTVIDELAFAWCYELRTVVIGKNVTIIGEKAFSGDEKLKSVTIPAAVTTIGPGAFGGCVKMTAIEVADDNTAYCDVDGVLFDKEKTILMRYPAAKAQTTYAVPESVVTIEDNAFGNCKALTDIRIPDGVTSIGDWAFYYCSGLTSLTIPGSVSAIGEEAFKYCGLTSVSIGDGFTTIGDAAFFYCDELFSIRLPDSLRSVGAGAFANCNSLRRVYYSGDEVDKNKVSFGINNDKLVSASWYYNICVDTTVHVYDHGCDVDCNVCGNTRRPAEHVYDGDGDPDCNVCTTVRDVGESITAFCGTSTHEEVNGLAFRFAMQATHIQLYNKYCADLSNAAVGDCRLIRMGAIASVEPNTTLDRDHLSDTTIDIEAKYLLELTEDGALFAVRIIDIPDKGRDTRIFVRPYYVFEDKAGMVYTQYGATQSSTYNEASTT